MDGMTTRTELLNDALGRPLHDLRVSVTDRCNLRCTYCMPAEVFGERYEFLPRSHVLTYEEIARVTRLLVGFGVTKVRLTGGEPLVRQDIETLVAQLGAIDGIEDMTLTTNGVLLPAHAEGLRQAGLERITVSLDSLDAEVFGAMNGRGVSPNVVLRGIEAAERAGLSPIKINAVIERGVNDHTAVDLARRFKGTGHIVRFIEFMDVGNLNAWERSRVVPSRELAERINAATPSSPSPPTTPARWRSVGVTWTATARLGSSRRSRSPSAANARAPDSRRKAASTPACSPKRHGSEGAAAGGRDRRGAPRPDTRNLDGAPRPLLGAARVVARLRPLLRITLRTKS